MTQGVKRRTDSRRLTLVTALSVLAHVAVFAWIGLSSPTLRARLAGPMEVISVTLPRLPPPPPAKAGRQPAAPRTAPPERLAQTPRLHIPAVAPPADVAPLAASPGAASSAAAGAAGAAGGSGRAATQFPSLGGQTSKVLRGTVGCNSRDAVRLTRAERDACDDHAFRNDPDAPAINGLGTGKRARFDQTAGKQQRDRDWRENPTIPTGTQQEQEPGHPAGVGPQTPLHAPAPRFPPPKG